jgi:dihydroorotase-like cyclic amidohydrolase
MCSTPDKYRHRAPKSEKHLITGMSMITSKKKQYKHKVKTTQYYGFILKSWISNFVVRGKLVYS